MDNFEKALEKLLGNEGYYSNVAADSGGETVFGISRNNFPKLTLWTFVDALKTRTDFPECIGWDKQILDMVNNFYRENFWDPIQGDKILNQEKAFCLFDFAVNSGVSQAVQIVQRALGVADDGIMGFNTLNGLNNANLEEFIAKCKIEKIKIYIKIVDRKPDQLKFLKGWIKRTLEMN